MPDTHGVHSRAAVANGAVGTVRPPSPARRAYIDWMRGLAVVIMILWHVMDAWTRREDRSTRAFGLIHIVGGMAAPLFMFLAGVSVALAAGGRHRKTGDLAGASAAVRRRGWQILGFALLFRLQAFLLSPGATLGGLLKVDILNVMGPSMVAAAAVWGLSARREIRLALLVLLACACALVTPPVRAAGWLGWLPDPVEWYLRPPAGRSWFALFPWAGMLFAGTAVGVLLDAARGEADERRVNAWLLGGGVALVAVALAGLTLPAFPGGRRFWATPNYFFLRIPVMMAMLGACYFWMRRRPPTPASGMLEFGHSSLFVYWVHVELAYGMLSYPLHRALPVAWALGGYVAFTLAMLWLARVKTRRVAEWKAQKRAAAVGPA